MQNQILYKITETLSQSGAHLFLKRGRAHLNISPISVPLVSQQLVRFWAFYAFTKDPRGSSAAAQ